ncbi:MAG: DUF1972 domain-containing protein [Saprospiraceae bacterium]
MQNTKKLAIIGTVGVPARYGGFETLAHQLVENLDERFEVTVYNSTHHYSAKERVKTWKGAKIKYIPLSANGVASIFYDIWSMIHAVLYCDILLILGVSGCLVLPFIKLFFPSKKLIVNIDGLEWRRPKWNRYAKSFLRLSERVAVWVADEVVADNAAIQKYVVELYGAPANLIEYGGDHHEAQKLSAQVVHQFPFLIQEYAFKVSRIEPENNIQMILDAFIEQNGLPLVLVGNWQNSEYGKSLYGEYCMHPQLHLLDPIYDQNILNELRSNAKVYIHGHSAGGTNPSLVEAMHLGLPIISFDVIYNRITTEHAAHYFENAKQLTKMIKFLNLLELDNIAMEMKAIANRRYRWSIIGEKYGDLILGKKMEKEPVFDFELPLALRQVMYS